MRFKKGDKVIVKDNLIKDKKYNNIRFVSDMEKFKGKIVTISRVVENDYSPTGYSYHLKEDRSRWHFSKNMLRHLNSKVKRIN